MNKFKENKSDYLETYFEVVRVILGNIESDSWFKDEKDIDNDSISYTIEIQKGMGGLWELAESVTDLFFETYPNVNWGEELEYFDTLEEFLKDKV